MRCMYRFIDLDFRLGLQNDYGNKSGFGTHSSFAECLEELNTYLNFQRESINVRRLSLDYMHSFNVHGPTKNYSKGTLSPTSNMS